MLAALWPVALVLLVGCSPKRYAIHTVADLLASNGTSLGSEDDPELLLEAIPFALLTMENVAAEAPDHVGLRASLAASFVQYAYASADHKAQLVKYEHYQEYKRLNTLARKRYLRGKRWGMEGLELRHPGFEEAMRTDPSHAVQQLTTEDLDLMYWTGAGWMAAISLGFSQAGLLAQLPQALALMDRALELNPDYAQGGLQEIFITIAMARPGPAGGRQKAKAYYDRALELSAGQRASVYVAGATALAVKTQDHALFLDLLEKALAIDPALTSDDRLTNILSQQRALYLKQHLEDLFDLPVDD